MLHLQLSSSGCSVDCWNDKEIFRIVCLIMVGQASESEYYINKIFG